MEIKKAKVKTKEFYRKNEYQGKTMYAFFITFENDDKKYVYNSSKEDPKYFAIGEEQEYEYELKTGTKKDGQPYEMHIVKPVYPKPAFMKSGGYQQMTLEEYIERQKVDSVGYALSYAKDLAVAGRVDSTKMMETAKTFLDWINMHMDKLNLKNK